MKPRIVLSGVNIVEAGPLSIFHDALCELSLHFLDRYEVVALVHRRALFDAPGIRYLEFPRIKSSWLRRLYFEYVSCGPLSRELGVHLWLSMHDITPRVTAEIRAVYCHNPAPFYHLQFREAMLDHTFALFCWLYRFLYGFGIARNEFVIVQQEWMRKEFRRCYKTQQIIVAHPSIASSSAGSAITRTHAPASRTVFFFPAYPRSFKNIELLLAAAQILEARGFLDFELWLTIHGRENRYAASLLRRYGMLVSVRWLGAQPRQRVEEMYAEADCLLFPSRLESWGMPLSEFKRTGKQMLVADLPYAHETVGAYPRVRFLSPSDPSAFAQAMQDFAQGKIDNQPAQAACIPEPFADGWRQLFRILLGEAYPAKMPAGAHSFPP